MCLTALSTPYNVPSTGATWDTGANWDTDQLFLASDQCPK